MVNYVLDFNEIDHASAAVVGGKGANLGELSRMEGVRVPPGFCVTTDAFRRIMAASPSMDDLLGRLSQLGPTDRAGIRALSVEIRQTIERTAMPDDIAAAIAGALTRLGEQTACAVRSSATAEDSPTASFAGQHDTYLNIAGRAAILEHVRRCWASLFSERAVTYRLRHEIYPRKVSMAVVVQRMVLADASGILFTADPITGNRKVALVEATPGLGEALVSGHVNADVYRVRDGNVVERHERQRDALAEREVLRLVTLGRHIEGRFGRPQDIEWCLAGSDLLVVQSRPITTLFPIPGPADGENHVYISVGHGQMMTDPLKPLGLSIRALTGGAVFHEAGGREFVDATRALASPASRDGLLDLFRKTEPLVADAVQTIVDRGNFIKPAPDAPPAGAPTAPVGKNDGGIETDPAIVDGLIARSQASIAALEEEVQRRSGMELLEFIQADFQELKRILFDRQGHAVFMSAMEASWWLNDHLEQWLGERNVADTLTLSAPNNVTSEMGLALLDVADAIRPHPDVVAFLEQVEDEKFLEELAGLRGGREARDAILAWLDKYGMRCPGEIDITRPRWSERPATLVPLILGNVRNFEPGAARRRFEQGRQEAARKEREVLERLRALPEGERKAEETKRKIERVRTFIGYREYPKYGMIRRYFVYKRAIMREADSLVAAGVIPDREDIFYLTFPELIDVVGTHRVDEQLIRQRKEAFQSYEALTPPRVITSDGEIVTGSYRRDDLPAGALVGLPVSAGTIEGRARVVLDMSDANLEPGDVLVTRFTDPSWTPLFVAIRGLVTEVGGQMTHGAVIAREYGLPAVVGLEGATRIIHDGQRIRVNGTNGYVEVLQ
jgi:pyruvate,water dikinase